MAIPTELFMLKAVNPIEIENFFKPAKWVVFVQPECEHSKKAVEILKKNEKAENIAVINIYEQNRVIEFMRYGHTSTPAIYRNDKCLGGYPELIQYYQRTFIDPKQIKWS